MRLSTLVLALGGLLLSLPASAQVGVWHPGGGRPVLPPSAVPDNAAVVQPVPSPNRMVAMRRLTPQQHLRQQLRQRRAANLARFVQYRDAGEFPRNHERPGMLNVFIDAEGHICAAANLMAQDGLLTRVRQVAAQNNFLQLADVSEGPLLAWMLSSGFTQEEIATIQEPYDFIEPDEPNEPMFEELEKQRLQARFRQIEAQLRAQEAASLNAATERLVAWREANGIAPFAPVLAQGDLFGQSPVLVATPTPPTPVVVPPPVVRPAPVVVHPNPIIQPTPVVVRPLPVRPTPVVVQPVVVQPPRVRVRVTQRLQANLVVSPIVY